MQEEKKIRVIIEKYELKIKNIEDKYNIIIESKDKQIEDYKDQIKFLREVITKNADKPIKIINLGSGNYNEDTKGDYIQGNKSD